MRSAILISGILITDAINELHGYELSHRAIASIGAILLVFIAADIFSILRGK